MSSIRPRQAVLFFGGEVFDLAATKILLIHGDEVFYSSAVKSPTHPWRSFLLIRNDLFYSSEAEIPPALLPGRAKCKSGAPPSSS